MTRKEKVKNMVISVVFWGVMSISFLFFSSLIVLKANGYQLNWKTWKLSKTGMIILNGNPTSVIFLDGVALKKQGFPNKISNLKEGTYEIRVSAPDYQDWSKNISVVSGQASDYENILLFKASPTDTSAPDNLTLEQLTAESKNLQEGLEIKDSEIFYQNKLVTRFSSTVLSAVIFTDQKHIVFQQARQIRAMDLDGSNNKLLFELSSDKPTPLAFRQNGSVLVYFDTKNSTVNAKIIR